MKPNAILTGEALRKATGSAGLLTGQVISCKHKGETP